MEKKYINIIPERNIETFHASQYETGRVIRCDLHYGAKSYILTGNESIRLRYRRPDGTVSSIPVEKTSGLSYVDITIPDKITEEAGNVYCKLRINDIGAKAFIIEVERKP